MREEIRRFPRRLTVLIFLFVLWGLLAAFQLVRYTVLQRDRLREESARLAWREGVIPPVRGQIADADGVLLVWSEMTFDLVLERMPADEAKRAALFRILREKTRAAIPVDAAPCILIRNIRHDEMKTLDSLCTRMPGLRIVPRMERKHVEEPAVRRLAPVWEKEYDALLRGEEGRFHVMLDRRGRWLNDTLRIDTESEPGRNVRLDRTLEQIRKESGNDGRE